jgi:hypothetical protein
VTLLAFPDVALTQEKGQKIKKSVMMRFFLKAENCRDTAAEESFRRNVIFTTLDFIIQVSANRVETHKYVCGLFSPVLNCLLLSCNELEEK